MLVKKDSNYKKPQDPKSFVAFLKKRAPIYLGLIGLFLLFVYPSLTEKDLNSILDDSFEGNERIVVDMVRFYSGPNDSGITILEVIEERINEKYEGQKIFDDEKTWAEFIVEKENETLYEIVFVFNTENNQSIRYEWHANIETGEIFPRDTATKTIQQVVDYSD
jgi:hypothetical protein